VAARYRHEERHAGVGSGTPAILSRAIKTALAGGDQAFGVLPIGAVRQLAEGVEHRLGGLCPSAARARGRCAKYRSKRKKSLCPEIYATFAFRVKHRPSSRLRFFVLD
jgi:hypothetical protein